MNSANGYTTYYDNLNRLRRVYQAGAGATVTPKLAYFTFDALDRLTVINRGEYDDQSGLHWTVTDSYAFDADSRMTGLTHLKGPTTLASYTWSYDRASRPTGFTSSLDGTAGYTYDSTSQLAAADYDYQTDESYSYDANGNRTNSGYSTGTDNRLASDGVYDYEYDQEGNRTRRTRISDGTVTEYTWDYRNRLTSVTERAGGVGTAATKVVQYKYDLNERLVGKTLDPDGAGPQGPSHEYYAYDQTPFSTRENASQMLFRFEGSELSDLKSRYLWAPVIDLLLSDEKLTGPSTPGDIYWTLGDNLNTVRDIARYNPSTDTTTIVNHRVYDAFGKLTSETNAAVDLIFAFTGRLFDDSTGLQNNLHRWYDPTIGRWLSEDPIGFAANDANLYRYVNNASTYASDPSGLQVSGGGANPPIIPAPAPAAAATVYSAPVVGGLGRHTSIQVEWDETQLVVEYQPQRVTVPGQPGVWMVFVRRLVQRQVHVVYTIELVRGPISGTGGSRSGYLLGSGPVLNAPGATWQIVYRLGYAAGVPIIPVNMEGRDARAIVTRIIDTAQRVGLESTNRSCHYYLLPTFLHAGRPENTCNSVTWEIMTRAGLPMPAQLSNPAALGWGNRFSDD